MVIHDVVAQSKAIHAVWFGDGFDAVDDAAVIATQGGVITELALSPDGRWLASGGADGPPLTLYRQHKPPTQSAGAVPSDTHEYSSSSAV